MALQKPFGERPDGDEVGEVELVNLDPGCAGERVLRHIRPASWDDDPSPRLGESEGRRETDAGVAARDDSCLAGEVDAGEDVSGRAVGAEHGVGRVAGHAADARC